MVVPVPPPQYKQYKPYNLLTKYASIRSIYQDVSCQASIERERVRDNVRWGAWLVLYVVIMAWHGNGTTHGTSLCCIACHCHNHNMIGRKILSSLFIYIWVAERRTMRPQRSFSIVTSLKWSEKSFALAALALAGLLLRLSLSLSGVHTRSAGSIL